MDEQNAKVAEDLVTVLHDRNVEDIVRELCDDVVVEHSARARDWANRCLVD